MNSFKDKMVNEVSDLSKVMTDIFRRLDQITKTQTATDAHLGGQIEKNNFHIWTKIEEVQANFNKKIDCISSQLATILTYLKTPSDVDKKERKTESSSRQSHKSKPSKPTDHPKKPHDSNSKPSHKEYQKK